LQNKWGEVEVDVPLSLKPAEKILKNFRKL
jgi:hypothetical protein